MSDFKHIREQISDALKWADEEQAAKHYSAAVSIDGYARTMQALLDENKRLRKELKGADDAKFNAFMAGLGPSRWEQK